MKHVALVVLILASATAAPGEGESVSVVFWAGWGQKWAGFKKGSWVRWAVESKSGDAAAKKKTKKLEVTEELEFAIRMKVTDVPEGGAEVVNETQETQMSLTNSLVRAGEEDLDVGGEKIHCEKLEARSAGGDVTATYWRARVGGKVLILKRDLPAEKGHSLAISSSFAVLKLEEEVKVGEVTLKCRVEESVSRSANFTQTARRWINESVPGWTVKEEITTIQGTKTSVSTKRLLDWHAEPKEFVREGEDEKK